MSEIVRCEICGGVYNQRHLRSHQRLSHSMKKGPVAPVAGERDELDKIVSLYNLLTNQERKALLNLLMAQGETDK